MLPTEFSPSPTLFPFDVVLNPPVTFSLKNIKFIFAPAENGH